jgi:hypothetical protein
MRWSMEMLVRLPLHRQQLRLPFVLLSRRLHAQGQYWNGLHHHHHRPIYCHLVQFRLHQQQLRLPFVLLSRRLHAQGQYWNAMVSLKA